MEADRTLGRYHLLRRHARGGMAELFIAAADGVGGFRKVVLLKRILPEYAADPEFTRLFLNEARLAATLSHPNVVSVQDCGIADDEYYFTMEYVHGTDLRGLLREVSNREAPIPIEHVLTIGAGMCAGLHHAHEQRGPDGAPLQLVHRDVSPGNILVSYDGIVKIADFGIARAAAQTTITRQGALRGKLAYMSPEQAQGEPLDRRSDVFAIGLVLHELLTGRRCFSGDNELALLHQIVFQDVVSPAQERPGTPDALASLVMSALARQPADRPQTAGEMRASIEAIAASLGHPLSTSQLGAYVRELVPAGPDPRLDLESATPSDAAHREPSSKSRNDEAATSNETVEPTIQIRGAAPTRRRWAVAATVGLLTIGGGWWIASDAEDAAAADVSAPEPAPLARTPPVTDARRSPAAEAEPEAEAKPEAEAEPEAEPKPEPEPEIEVAATEAHASPTPEQETPAPDEPPPATKRPKPRTKAKKVRKRPTPRESTAPTRRPLIPG